MAINEDLENLKLIPLFALFEAEALRSLAFGAETRLLRAGDRLFRRGEESDGGFILAQGSIALEIHDDGRAAEKILRPWALLGEIALVAPTVRPVTATAREPTKVFRISRDLFAQVLEQRPTTAARVRDLFRSRLEDFTRHLSFDAT